MMRLPDIYDYYRSHEAEQERWLASRPVCDRCGEPIQDEYMWEVEDGYCVCEECRDEWLHEHRREI